MVHMAEEIMQLARKVVSRVSDEEVLKALLISYLERRLDECRGKIRDFELKYGMNFEEFEKRLSIDFPLTYEHEMDYARWGALLDEVEELEKLLRKLR